MTCQEIPCPPWCERINGKCQPTLVQVNAVRLRTRDAPDASGNRRYLQATNGGGGGVVATWVAPEKWETFLFIPPTTWPLVSGDPISLEVCSDDEEAPWGPSGYLVRVAGIPIPIPVGDEIQPFQFGGPNMGVLVTNSCISTPGCAGWSDEWTFFIRKAGGGSITTGDEVTLATSSDFLFRTTGPQDRAVIHADGSPDQAGTVFVVEFNQVMVGLGWRPPVIECQTCGTVTGTVTDASTGQPIFAGPPIFSQATVEAQGTNFKAATGANGDFTLADTFDCDCVPAGNWTLSTKANYYQPGSNPVTVPAGGSVNVPIKLKCTEVKGKVVDGNGQPIKDVRISIFLLDANDNQVFRPNRSPIEATTNSMGEFVISCVPHGNWVLWADDPTGAYPTGKKSIIVPPEGLANQEIKLSCGDVVGTVKDANTGQPIEGARVKRLGSGMGEDEATTGRDGIFRIKSVCLTGLRSLRTTAPGYQAGTNVVDVPATGDSAPVDIKLRPVVVILPFPASEIILELTWDAQPADLDSHLSGPNNPVLGDRFHIRYDNKNPVNFATLDLDDTDAQGPERVTVRRIGGGFRAGEYHYWVHNYSRSTFAGSGAEVKMLMDGREFGRYLVKDAIGNPADDIWHVVNLQINRDGTAVVPTVIQKLQPGDENITL